VNQSSGAPPYPPERNAWQFPPPPVSRRWLWVAILAIVSSLVAAVGLGVAGAVIASKDFPNLIEDRHLLTVIGHECQIMTDSIESMPVEGTPKEQAAIVIDQDRAVERMLRAIRQVDARTREADKPTDMWLDDWDRLVEAREQFADLVARGKRPVLHIPRDADGNFVDERMNDVWLTTTECTVPDDLVNPYPKNIDDI
jgi:hypothetical protein